MSLPRISMSDIRGISTMKAVEQLTSLLQDKNSRRAAPMRSSTDTEVFRLSRVRSDLAIEISKQYNQLPSIKPRSSEDCERCKILNFLATNVQGQTSPQHSNLRDSSSKPNFEKFLELILQQHFHVSMPFVISLRQDLLEVMRTSSMDDIRQAKFKELNQYLQSQLTSHFSPKLLETRRITYDQTATSIIEVISQKEAVHPIKSLDDLRNRLGAGRRVFALFSPLLPDQPIAFCHVALTNDIPSSLPEILEDTSKELEEPKVAAFYSISNSQPGLSGGLGLGEHLLKECIYILKKEFPSIKSFVTLSPIPGFKSWVESRDSLMSEHYDDKLSKLLNGIKRKENFGAEDKELTFICKILLSLAAKYLLKEKRGGRPFDGVCRFHISNGAEVYRLNFGADLSQRGIQQSFSIMVNYRYNLDKIEENQASYESGNDIPVTPRVLDLINEGKVSKL